MKGKKMLKLLGRFLIFMLACTMLSRASSSLTVAVVQTTSPGKMVISHRVFAAGKVEENQERAVSAQAGQKISQIFVQEGDLVNPKDALLQVDLQTLREQIAACDQELEKIELELADLESAQNIQEEKRELAIRRAQEDYQTAAAKGDQAVAWAASERDQAAEKLKEYYQKTELEQEEEDALIQEFNAANKAYEEAVAAREADIQAAVRAMEDAQEQEPADSSIPLKKIESKEKQVQRRKLKKLEKAGGKILSPVKGTVTKLNVSVGEWTAETPLLLLADLTTGCKFTAQVEQEQEQYLEKDAPVTLTNERKKLKVENLKIHSVEANPEDSSLLDVCIYLPADTMSIGDSAEMTVEQKSQTYNTCVPIQALHEASGQYFVYVIQEKDTVLGEQLTARSVKVTVQEQNETYAALDDGCLSSSQKVITDSSKGIDEGSPVRLDAS